MRYNQYEYLGNLSNKRIPLHWSENVYNLRVTARLYTRNFKDTIILVFLFFRIPKWQRDRQFTDGPESQDYFQKLHGWGYDLVSNFSSRSVDVKYSSLTSAKLQGKTQLYRQETSNVPIEKSSRKLSRRKNWYLSSFSIEKIKTVSNKLLSQFSIKFLSTNFN